MSIESDAPTARIGRSSSGEGFAPRLPGRIPSLDGLRAISIVLVLVGHTAGTRYAPAFIEKLHHLGNLGVKVFFEISGFLITTLLLKEFDRRGRIDLKGFYLRRVLRIFPAFYCYIGVVYLMYVLGAFDLSMTDILHAVTFTMNYHEERGWRLNHLWSLAVEEQFYLLWPWVVALAGPRRAIRTAGIVVIVALPIRMVMWSALQMSPTAMTRQFQAIADSLAIGCLFAGGFNALGERRTYTRVVGSPWFPIVPGIVLASSLVLFVKGQGLFYVFGQSLANVAIALMIDHCVRFPNTPLVGRFLNLPPVAFFGTLSYSLYLWQELFLNPVDRPTWYTSFPVNLILSVAAALGSYYLVETPFLKLKSRLSGGRTHQV